MSPADLFSRPDLLPLVLLGPALGLATFSLDRLRAGRLRRALGPRAVVLAADVRPGRRALRRALFATALSLALLAAAGPLGGTREGAEQRGVDIVACLDVSRSMLATDVAPSRLERAKAEIRGLAERAAGDRLALVAFSGRARMLVPLTRDLASLTEIADLADPTLILEGGTDLDAALSEALAALEGGPGKHAAVLLLSDGGEEEDRDGDAVSEIRRRGIAVHCVGFGTTRGAKIPVMTEAGPRFLTDRDGREVVTTLNAAGLRAVAEATDGSYTEIADGPGTLAGLYAERILPMARKAFATEERRERVIRFQTPLLAAFVIWILTLCISERRR